MKIESVTHREKLNPRREPYWQLLAAGRHVGFRKTASGGSWIARAYDPATRTRAYEAFREVSQLPGSMQFSEASKRAREWFHHLDKGGLTDTLTVLQACQRYVDHQRNNKGETAAADALRRIERDLKPHRIANVELHKLKPQHVAEWREYMRTRPAKQPIRGLAFDEQPDREGAPKAAATLNRDMTMLRAALNLAKRDGYVTTDVAWLKALTPLANADGRREIYLDREQRRELIALLEGSDSLPFVKALCMLPLRPGALADALVGDLDVRTSTLTVQRDKAGAGRKIPLPSEALALFQKQTHRKLPRAPLFARVSGGPWHKDAWKIPVRRAVDASALPLKTTLYAVRHSVITDLVTGGLDIFTVATLAGTSVRMIEKHYGHLRQEHARAALSRLSL